MNLSSRAFVPRLVVAFSPFALLLAAASAEAYPPRARPYPIDIAYRSPAPPAPGSPSERRDLDGVLERQRARTAADCRRANFEVSLGFDHFYGPPYGPLGAEEVKRLLPFFDRIQSTTQALIKREKDKWERPRPFRTDPAIQPCVHLEPSYFYSSGHTAIAHVFAIVLRQMDPARAAVWDERARQIGEDRIIGGVHYPTDVAEGAATAPYIAEALLANPEFQGDLKAATASLIGD
jgi:acid phosphatase (class A)